MIANKRTITRSRGNANQTGNNTGAEPDETELPLVGIVEENPSDATTARREIGVDNHVNHAQAEVATAGTVEGEPPEPDEAGADAHEQRAMRLVVDQLLLALLQSIGFVVVETGSKHHGPGQSAEAAGDMDGTGTGKVVEAELVQPTAGVPFPVGETVEWVVSS